MNKVYLKSAMSNLIAFMECCDCLEDSFNLLFQSEDNALSRMFYNDIRFSRDLADSIHNILSYISKDGEINET